MKKFNSHNIFKIFLIVIFILFISCDMNFINQEKTLIYGYSYNPKTLEFYETFDTGSLDIVNNIYDTLINIDFEKGELVPSLAKTWRKKDNIWEFKLREDIEFHNGNAFDAYDVEYSFKKYILDSSKIKVIDKYTIQIDLDVASVIKLYFLAMPRSSIVDKETMEEFYSKSTTESVPVPIIGTGAFKFSEWIENDYILLKANKKYFQGKPHLDAIKYKILLDEEQRTQELGANNIDVASIFSLNNDVLKINNHFTFKDIDIGSYLYAVLNFKNQYLANKNVRKALIYASNREKIIQEGLLGAGELASTPITPNTFAYKPTIPLEYSVAKANEILDKEGYERNKEGIRFTLKAYTYNKQEMFVRMLKEDFKEIGVNLEVIVLTWQEYLESIKTYKHDIAVLGNVNTILEASALNPMFHSSFIGINNFSFYQNEYLDALLDRGILEVDIKKRKEIYSKAIDMIMSDYIHIPISYNKERVYISNKITNFKRYSMGIDKPYLIQKNKI